MKRNAGCMVVILARLIVGYPIQSRPDGKKTEKIVLAQSKNNKKCQPDQNKHGRNGGRSESRAGRNKEGPESLVRQAGGMNNTSEYVTDKDDNCVSCGKVVTEANNGAECSRWEHSICAGLNTTEYNILSGSSPKIMFFCTKCQPKINMTLRFFNYVREKQNKLD